MQKTFFSMFSKLLSRNKQQALPESNPDPECAVINLEDFQPDDPPRMFITPFGTVYQDYSGATITTKEGAVHRISRDGQIENELPVIRRMEIADISQVEKHQINRVHETTSHVIHFIGGGVFTCVYDDHGKMIETSSRGLNGATSNDGVITLLGTHRPNQA